MKIKCYFAHPFRTIGSEGEKRIISALERRGVIVINPFIGEDKLCEKYNVKSYYPKTLRKLGREIWIKDLKQIKESNLFLMWSPEFSGEYGAHFNTTARGCYAELQYAIVLQRQKKLVDKKIRERYGIGISRKDEPYLIQMITKDRHPIIAYALQSGNQLYSTIEEFEKLKQSKF